MFFIFIQVRVSIEMEGASASQFRSICVFCGSSPGKNKEFVEAANNLGKVLAERKINLVYGGGSLGLMGCVSTAAHLGGNRVLGLIPEALAKPDLTGTTVGDEFKVASMHERMARMLSNSDAFIALPGSFGTLEEIFQIASWAQLNIHRKPIGLLNVDGFFNCLLCFLKHAVYQGFISNAARKILVVASTADELIDKLQAFVYEPDPATIQIDWSDDSHKKRKLDLNLHL